MFSENPAKLHYQIMDYFGTAYQEHKAECEPIIEQQDEQLIESEGHDE